MESYYTVRVLLRGIFQGPRFNRAEDTYIHTFIRTYIHRGTHFSRGAREGYTYVDDEIEKAPRIIDEDFEMAPRYVNRKMRKLQPRR